MKSIRELKEHYGRMMTRYAQSEEYAPQQGDEHGEDWIKFTELFRAVTYTEVADVTERIQWFLKATEEECLQMLMDMVIGEYQCEAVKAITNYADRTDVVRMLQNNDQNGCYLDHLAVGDGMNIMRMEDIKSMLLGWGPGADPEDAQMENLLLIIDIHNALVEPLLKRERQQEYFRANYSYTDSVEMNIEGADEDQIQEMVDLIDSAVHEWNGRTEEHDAGSSKVWMWFQKQSDLIHAQYAIAKAFDRANYECDLNDPVTGLTV